MGWLAALLALSAAAPAFSFNIDTKNAVVHQKNSVKFGYSLDFYYEQKKLPVLMVGAPEAESTQKNLRSIRKPGAVFACSLTQANTCKEVQADQDEGNERRLHGSVMKQIEDKTKQFFGATVVASSKHDKLMLCAPQYKYFFTKFEVIEPVGTCFYLESGNPEAYELPSCKQDNQKHGRHRLGYGQCGFSAAVPDAGGRSFIGAPGMFYWQGGVFSQSNTNYSDRLNSSYSSKEYDHHMMGYSTAVADFDGDGAEDVVAGAPRGDDLMGKLVMYTTSLKNIANLTDTSDSAQTGQYCGHAVIAVDVNKDGRKDIITGCPMFTDYVTVVDAKTQERKPQYEVGKVLVFLQTAAGVFSKPIVIVGEEQWGRFGFSLANAGDLNQDGYNDIIVGAPQGGKDMRGAVYVIHGSADGVRTKYTQKIDATSLGNNIRQFGFSVAGGVDVDGNGIPDIAAGAVRSGSAIIMLAKPVVTVTGRTELDRGAISIDDKDCDVDKKIGRQACRTLKTCLKYEGKGETPNDLDFLLTYNIDDLSQQPRAHFISREINEDRTISVSSLSKTKDHPNVIERKVRLNKNRETCFSQRFFVSSTMRDKLTPIHYRVNYTYEGSTTTGRLRGGNLEPAIDNTVPQSFDGKLSIANNCGKDDLCIPNLAVKATADRPKFILGTKDNSMVINVDVNNQGEDAFESKLYVDVPEGFEFTEAIANKGQTPTSCTPIGEEDGLTKWECDIGNPIPSNKHSELAIRFSADEKNPPLEPVTFRASVNSTNPEAEGTGADNLIEVTVPIDFEHSLTLVGQTNPEQIDFHTASNSTNQEKFDDRDIGPVLTHLFQISNNGPSKMDVSLDIFWPSFSTEGNHLLYLITDPVLSKPDKGRCRVKQAMNVNPLNLMLTNEHLPTQPPPKEYDAEEQGEGEAEEEEEEHPRTHDGRRPEIQYETSIEEAPAPTNVDGLNTNMEWKPNDKFQPEYEYIPDEYPEDDVEEDDYGRKERNKRQTKQQRRKQQPQGGQRIAPKEKPDRDKARFTDLRAAVELSKKSGQGTIEYKGIISRASVDCSTLHCTHIECDLTDLEKDDFVLVHIYSRLAVDTLIQEKNPGGEVSSLAVARVVNQNKNWGPRQTLLTAVTTTLNAVSPAGSGGGVPWWLYLLAILVGLLLLALLILLLWRCGFFKRNRPQAEKAELRQTQDPQARYADTKTRYAPGGEQYDERGAML